MRNLKAFLIVGVITAAAAAAASTEAKTLTKDDVGVTVTLPDELDDLNGLFIEGGSSFVSRDPDLSLWLFGYEALPKDEAQAVYDGYRKGDEEATETFYNNLIPVAVVRASNADAEELSDYMHVFLEDMWIDGAEEKEVSSVGDYTFSVILPDVQETLDNTDPEYAEEFAKVRDLVQDAFGNAEYKEPVDPISDLIGKTISFTSTDVDGNTMTSEELFAENEITMVNLWGIWCPNCLNEMAELAEIHTRLREKGCGIVGVEFEYTYNDEKLQESRDKKKKYGTNYPSVLMPEDCEILQAVRDYPTTFFVNKDGEILTEPVVGAKVDQYEAIIDGLLG